MRAIVGSGANPHIGMSALRKFGLARAKLFAAYKLFASIKELLEKPPATRAEARHLQNQVEWAKDALSPTQTIYDYVDRVNAWAKRAEPCVVVDVDVHIGEAPAYGHDSPWSTGELRKVGVIVTPHVTCTKLILACMGAGEKVRGTIARWLRPIVLADLKDDADGVFFQFDLRWKVQSTFALPVLFVTYPGLVMINECTVGALGERVAICERDAICESIDLKVRRWIADQKSHQEEVNEYYLAGGPDCY